MVAIGATKQPSNISNSPYMDMYVYRLFRKQNAKLKPETTNQIKSICFHHFCTQTRDTILILVEYRHIYVRHRNLQYKVYRASQHQKNEMDKKMRQNPTFSSMPDIFLHQMHVKRRTDNDSVSVAHASSQKHILYAVMTVLWNWWKKLISMITHGDESFMTDSTVCAICRYII